MKIVEQRIAAGGGNLPRVRQMGLCGAYVLFGASRILTVEPWYRLLGLT